MRSGSPTPGCSAGSCAGGSPGSPRDVAFDALFREPPFTVLQNGERALVSGLVGRIWTLRRDYPQLARRRRVPRAGRAGARPGWCSPTGSSRPPTAARRCRSEARVQALGSQGRLGVAAVRPLVRAFQNLVGSEGLSAAVRRAEQRTEASLGDLRRRLSALTLPATMRPRRAITIVSVAARRRGRRRWTHAGAGAPSRDRLREPHRRPHDRRRPPRRRPTPPPVLASASSSCRWSGSPARRR